jgi:hypothetical protein
VEVSLQRFGQNGEIALGPIRLIDAEEGVEVEDEDLLALDTADGGSALVSGCGPDGPGTSGCDWSIEAVSPTVAALIYRIAASGAVVARWPSLPRRRAFARTYATGPPVATAVTDETFVTGVPAGWPQPAVLHDVEELLRCLRQL